MSPSHAPATARPADWIAAAPFTLTLSAGFFGFYAHTGFVLALAEAGLTPARITGSSAGALVGACLASGLGPRAIADLVRELRRQDFWDPGLGRGLLRGERLHRFLADRLPVARFDDLAIPLAVSAWDLRTRRTVVLDRGDLLAAARASAAFPLLFQPVLLEGRSLLDGGILDRPGFEPTHEGERILYHHLRPDSPWRKPEGDAPRIERRPGLVTFSAGALPRLGPFRMDDGPDVIERVRARALRWLETEQELPSPLLARP